MSANNQYFAAEIGPKWHGWMLMAESWLDEGESVEVDPADAIVADDINDLEEALDEIWGYAEYGITTRPFLVKDGTPITIKGYRKEN